MDEENKPYVFQEYPKDIGDGVIVNNAAEEAAAKGKPPKAKAETKPKE